MDGDGGSGTAAGGQYFRVLTDGGRQRYEVALKPGETTIVSWKKLVRDANSNRASAADAKGKSPAVELPSVSQPALDSRVDPAKSPADDAKDAPPASRFNAVIEKIERLYMGKNSSDEEDLNDVPDDDEYDTEDSFIDDAELDEYFQVDNSAIKHDGFFVNRGKLERINEPAISPHTQQQKKRKRKDLVKGPGGNDEGNAPNKNLAGKKAAGKSLTLPEKNSANQTLVMALPTVKCEDMITQNQSSSSGINVKKKSATVKSAQHHSSLRVSNGEAIAEDKGGKFKAGVLPVKNHGSKSKDGNAFSDMSQMLNGNISSGQGKPLSGISLGIGGGVGQSAQHGELNRIRERSDSIYSEGRNSMQATRKEGSSIKSKATMLEKAIRELEKMVAESRPPSTEASDADISQNIKRRMPPEIKPKLAKIARLAHSAHGKISKELLNRLMSIVGHLIQLRTLKRNLKVLGDMGLSAKEENNARFQQIKKEISEMVKVRIPLMKSKALELPGGTSDDFQENGAVDKEVHKRKFSMDDALEDKICDLYDFYIEGVEEDSGPQAHKLYAELADLWPKGFMDNSGIKRAICRAKDRKKARHSMNKNQDKMKRKSNSKTDEARQGEINSVLQSQYAQEKLVADSRGKSADKSVSGITIAVAAQVPNATVSQHVERPKQEKVKVNSNDIKKSDIVGKRKLKNKSEMELGEADSRSDKMITEPGEERNKSLKQTAASSPRTAL